MKESFVLFTEQKEIFENLSNEQAGQLIKAVFSYIETEKIPKMDTILNIAFIPIRQALDRNNDKWEDIKQKRSEAGKIGAEIKKQKQAKEANANFAKKEIAKQAVNVNDNVNVSVNVNNNNKSGGCVDGSQNASESCVDGLQSIIDFYENNIGFLSPYGLEIIKSYLKKMPADVIIYAIKISIEANKRTIQYIKGILNNWEKAGIKTLIEAKEENKNKTKRTEKASNFNQRKYNDLDNFYVNIKKGAN